MSDQINLDKLWQQVQEHLHEGDIDRSLWDAAAVAKPLVLEDDVLVLGLRPADMRHASYLTSTLQKPKVQDAVEAALGRRVDIETIEGTTLEAWEHEKERQVHRAERAEAQLRTRMAAAGAERIWGDLHEQVGKAFGAARDRRFPLSRARMVASALKAIREAEERAHEEEPEAGEAHDNQVNRALDRVAVFAEMPPTVVAIEYLRMCSRKG
jgi:hypothetical protein